MVKCFNLIFLFLFVSGCTVLNEGLYTCGSNYLWLYPDSTFEYQEYKGRLLSYWSYGQLKLLPANQMLLTSAENIDSVSINVVEEITQGKAYVFEFENEDKLVSLGEECNYTLVINNELRFQFNYREESIIRIQEPIINFFVSCDYELDIYNSLNKRIRTKYHYVNDKDSDRFIVKSKFLPIHKYYVGINDTINILSKQKIYWINQNAFYNNSGKCKTAEKQLNPNGYRQ